MDQEQISLEVDERPAVNSLGKANAAMDEYEKRASSAVGGASQAFQNYGENIVRITDRSRSSIERLVASIEKQAATYEKSGVERLVAQRDLLIHRLGDEQQAVDRVRLAYQKMIEAQSARGDPGGESGLREIGRSTEEARASLALLDDELGVRIPRHLRGFIAEIPGVGSALSAAFSGVAIGAIVGVLSEATEKVVKLHEELEKVREMPERLAAEFSRMQLAGKLNNDQLALTNARLEQSIAKLEHTPGNGVKTAIMEARVEADKLADSMDKSLEAFQKIIQENRVGLLGRFIGHTAGSKDIEEMVGGKTGFGGMRGELLNALNSGADPTAVLEKYQREALEKLARAEYSQAAQQGRVTKPVASLGPAEMVLNQGGRIEELQGLLGYIGEQRRGMGLEKQSEALTKRNDVLQGNQEFDDKLKAARDAITKAQSQQDFDRNHPYGVMGVEAQLRQYYEQVNTPELRAHTTELMAAMIGVLTPKRIDENKAALDKLRNEGTEKLRKLAGENFQGLHMSIQAQEKEMTGALARETTHAQSGMQISNAAWTANFQMGQAQELGAARLRGMARFGPDAATQTAAEEAAIKQRYIDTQYQHEMTLAAALHAHDGQLEATEQDLKSKFDKDRFETQMGYQEALAAEERKRFEEIANAATGLYHTLFTHPQAFPKQLQTTLRNAALHPFEQQLGNLTAGAITGVVSGPRITDGAMHVMIMNWGGGPNTNVPSLSGTGALPYFGAAAALSNSSTSSTPFFGSGISPSFGSDSSSSIPFFSSAPSYTSAARGGGGGFGGFGGRGMDLGSLLGAPGGTTGFNGPVSMGAEGSVGGRGGAFNVRSLTGLFKGGWSGLGGFTRSSGAGDVGSGNGDFGGETNNPAGGGITGVSGFAGAGLMAGGSLLAMKGLMGKDEGTGAGILMGAGGGAAIGMAYGGPIGAGIGAAVGAGIGVGEMLAGVQSPVHEVESLVKRRYGIGIEDSEANKIVSLAQSKYGGQYSVAVGSPEVRQMLGLYAAGTGQANKFPVSATTPMGGGLEMQGGKLMQSAIYKYGDPYSYTSNVSVAGGNPGQNIPTPGSVNLSLSVANQGAADFLAGNVVTSDFVQAQWSSAAASSNGRVNNSAMLTDPGLLVS